MLKKIKIILKKTTIMLLVLGFFLSTNVLTIVKSATNILIPPSISYVEENETTVEKQELEHLRGSNYKVYLMPDYTLEYVYYDKDIHYYDGSKYQEITSYIKEEHNTTTVYNNNYEVIFPNSLTNSEIVELKYGDYTLSYSFLDINTSNIGKLNEGQYSKITYENIKEEIDLEYYVLNQQLKENIILKEYTEDFSFSYILNTNGLTLEQSDDLIYLKDNDINVFEILPVFMIDNSGNTSYDIEFEVVKLSDLEYKITITPNNDFLSSSNYPVTIDPIVDVVVETETLSENNITIRAKTHLYNYDSSIPFCEYLYVASLNDDYYGILELTRNTTLSYDEAEIVFTNSGTGTGGYSVYRLGDGYDFDSLTGASFPISDKNYIGNSSYISSTCAVSYNDVFLSSEEAILVFIPYGEGEVEISSGGAFSASPFMRITNVSEYDGINTTYYEINNDLSGSGKVNLINGELSYSIAPYTFEHENNPFNIEFAYSSDRTLNYGYGRGWSINYLETIDISTDYVIYLKNAWEEKTVFWHDEGSFISVNNNNDIITNETANDEVRYIRRENGVIKVYEVVDEEAPNKLYLTKIETTDKYTGTLDIKHLIVDGNVVIDKIIDGAGNVAKFSYSTTHNKLTTIRYSMKSYSSPNGLSISSSGVKHVQCHYNGDYLKMIWKQDDRKDTVQCEVLYNLEYSDYKLTKVYFKEAVDDPSEYSMGKKFTYRDDMVCKVETYNPNNGALKLDANIYYGANKAKVEEKDTSINYYFDIYGNVIKTYDSLGNISIYKYENTFNNQNNLVDYEIINNNSYNYLSDPAYLTNSFWQSTALEGVGNITIEASDITIGQNKVKINRSTTGELKYYQSVNLPVGKYIVSSNILNENTNGEAYIEVCGNEVEIITCSKGVKQTEEYEKYFVEFEVTNRSDVTISLTSDAIGEVYFDYCMLSTKRENIKENLIENSSFENGLTSWNGQYEVVEYEEANKLLGNNYLVAFYNDYVSQTINTSGLKGDRIDLSMYVKAYSYLVDQVKDTYLEIIIEINNSDNTQNKYYISSSTYDSFEENFEGEFVNGSIYATKAYDSITIKFKPNASEGSIDEVMFVDMVSLTKTSSMVTSIINQIDELSTDITLAAYEEIKNLNGLYVSLSEAEKSLVTNSDTLVNAYNQVNVLYFNDLLSKIEEPLIDEVVENIVKLESFYNNLTDETKELLTSSNITLYNNYVKEKNIYLVEKQIDELPNDITLEDIEKVYEASQDYSNLSEAEKEGLTNKSKLEEKLEESRKIELNYLITLLPTTNIFEDLNTEDYIKEETASLIIYAESIYDSLDTITGIENLDLLFTNISNKNSYISSINSRLRKIILDRKDYGYNNQYLVKEENNFGGTIEYTYDTVSSTINSITDALGNKTEYNYGEFDYLLELKQIISDEETSLVTYEYDLFGRIIQIIKNGTTYTFTYDVVGNITSISRDNIYLALITYLEIDGIPSSYVDEYIYNNNLTVKYVYNDDLQVIEIKHNNVTKYTYKYDMLGNIVETSTGNYKYYYTYTYSGELALKTDSNGNKITYNEDSEIIKVFDNEFQINYNNNEEELFEEYDNLKVSYDEIVNDDGIKISDVIIYTIDEEEFLRKTINYDNYNITSIAYCYSDKKVEYHYTYTLKGNLASVITKYYNSDDELEKTITEEYTYDSKNQLSIHKVFENNIQILDVQYVYDGYGNIQKVTRNIHSNEYLELPGYEEYIYDNVYKDLLITKIEKESVNGVLINTYNYVYDSTNSNLTIVKKNDVIIEEYTYDYRNLITYINEETRIEYKYNSEGIRYQKDIYDKETNTLIETRKYFLDGIKIIAEEITKDNDISVVYYRYNQNEEVIGYTYETKLDRYEYTYIKNYQGDILGIIDNNGIEQTNYIYDAYGRVVSGNIESNSLLYRSYYYDTETSYYYLNSRYYNPQNNRFQIADDITYLGITGTLNSYNLFSYCEGEPVNLYDSKGTFGIIFWWRIKKWFKNTFGISINNGKEITEFFYYYLFFQTESGYGY